MRTTGFRQGNRKPKGPQSTHSGDSERSSERQRAAVPPARRHGDLAQTTLRGTAQRSERTALTDLRSTPNQYHRSPTVPPPSVSNGVESANDCQKALGWFLMRRYVLLLACAHSICSAQGQQSDAPEGAATSTAPASSSQSRQWACNPPDRQSVVAFPREAAALGLTSGHVLVQFTIEAGEVLDVLVLETTHPTFSEAAVKMVKAINCKTEKGKAMHGVRVRVPFDFSLR